MIIDIENVGEDTYVVRALGHHDPHDFMRAVREAGYDWPLGMPEHKYCRTIPTRDPGMRCIYALSDSPGRGAYPVTYAWEAYNEDTYERIVAAIQQKGAA